MFTVGIIGRPNVGKSSLFNRIAGKRIAIVDNMPGVTRDRLEEVCEWDSKKFKLFDTAGFDLKDDIIKKQMQEQFFLALNEVDLCLLVVDAKDGLHQLDEIVADILRKRGKRTILVVNKVDNSEYETMLSEFYALGFEDVVWTSASHGINVDELLDKIISFVEDKPENLAENAIKIAIIGKPNVGKSSLINAWLKEERVIVTQIPGTTRDAVNIQFKYKNDNYILVDTAGIRKKSVMFKDKIEKYGYFRGYDSIESADICVAVVDSAAGLLDGDLKIIGGAAKLGRPVIVVFNKWDTTDGSNDLAKKLTRNALEKLQYLNQPPILFVSAVTGKNIYKVFTAIRKVYDEYSKRIQTSKLNEILQYAQEKHQPPVVKNKRLKFFYMTQVGVRPPEFVIFVNYPEAVHFSYERFILNLIRKEFGFEGIPLKINFRQKGNRNEYPSQK